MNVNILVNVLNKTVIYLKLLRLKTCDYIFSQFAEEEGVFYFEVLEIHFKNCKQSIEIVSI